MRVDSDERAAEGGLTVAAIMSPDPIVVTPDTSLDRAICLMDDNEVRHLPVVDGDELLGVLSDRDLLEATGWLRSGVLANRGTEVYLRMPRRVGDIMQRPVARVAPETPLVRAAIEFLERGIGCLLVVDGQRLVGILTEIDLVAAFVAGRLERPGSSARTSRVGEWMTPAPTVIHWYTSLAEATEICRANDVRHLPVLEAGHLVGILSDRDLRRAVGTGRSSERPVDDIVTREPVTVSPGLSLQEAAATMIRRKFSALPVVEGDVLRGILTMTDVLEVCFGECRA